MALFRVDTVVALYMSSALLFQLIIACLLQAPSSVMLKVSANSTRRALWDTKLGFHPHAKPFHIPLHSVRPDGGKVGCTSFAVARVYPLLYMEKRPDGSKAFRTKRAEEKAARASDSRRQRIIEGICERERKKFENEVQQEGDMAVCEGVF